MGRGIIGESPLLARRSVNQTAHSGQFGGSVWVMVQPELEGRMHEDTFVSAVADSRAREEILEHGFTRHPLHIDVDVARALSALAHAAWFLPKDQYYEGGDRYRSLNRFKAEIVDGGVRVWPCDESQPYVQLEKYN